MLPDALFERASSQWFTLILLAFVPCFTATAIWVSERRVLRRETADGTYGVWLFYCAKVLSVIPFEIFFGERLQTRPCLSLMACGPGLAASSHPAIRAG